MDQRLKEVHQTDLTEGRINQDFLDWLKTKGTSWLLVILIALCVYAGIMRWKGYRENYQAEAWKALSAALLPSNFDEVAEKYKDVGAVALLARIRAADQLLTAVQSGKTLGADVETKTDLTDEQRTDYLDKADRYFAQVIEADDQKPEKTLLIGNALAGRAAVAECKGDLEHARQFYEQAAQRTESHFPKMAEQARQRAGTLQDQAVAVVLPTKADLDAVRKTQTPAAPLEPVPLEPWSLDLIMPKP